MAITKFLESGTDATQGFEFYTTTAGTVASATDQAHTGPRSIKMSTGAGNAAANVRKSSILASAGRRVSFYFRTDSLPTTKGTICQFFTSGGSSVYSAEFQTDGTLSNIPGGATTATGTKVLSTNTWYRICISFYFTTTTDFTFKIYIDGVLDSTANAGTMSGSPTFDRLSLAISAIGANKNHWFDDIYVDDGASSSSQPDTSNIFVTNKRPNANGTTNGWTGTGAGSGYGTGNSVYVNEQPLSTASYVSVVGAGSAVTEEYNIENASTGDVNITGLTLVDYVGWVYTTALIAETGKIIVNNVSSNISITTSNAMFTAFAGSTTYPAGTGTDIGEITSTTVTTVTLYECGIIFAYNPAVAGTARLKALMGVGL